MLEMIISWETIDPLTRRIYGIRVPVHARLHIYPPWNLTWRKCFVLHWIHANPIISISRDHAYSATCQRHARVKRCLTSYVGSRSSRVEMEKRRHPANKTQHRLLHQLPKGTAIWVGYWGRHKRLFFSPFFSNSVQRLIAFFFLLFDLLLSSNLPTTT